MIQDVHFHVRIHADQVLIIRSSISKATRTIVGVRPW